ncbi:MAG: metallophosphoesterase [Bacteroidaceae bacterium]|nr:metallophosphoesterase [Bacteroidaceae bacterium]
MKYLLLGIIIISVLLALLPHIIYILAKLVGLVIHLRISYRPFGYAALVLVAVWILTAIYGNVYGRFRHEVKQVNLTFSNLPASFDGLRIVHISDLHLDGWVGHEKELQKRIDEINALQPDIICFTGDLVSLSPNELKPFIPILKQLRTNSSNKRGAVYSVLGNHDYLPYTRIGLRAREAAVKELIRMEREELGWRVLLNESDIIRRGNDSIAILGCENQSVGAHPVIQRGDLRKALKSVSDERFSLLLTHDPSQWRKEVVPETDIPLTLSGHTHAMQLRILGFTPSKWIYPECDGLYTEGNQHLYVNIGLGGTLPWRIGATPEITLITLKRR